MNECSWIGWNALKKHWIVVKGFWKYKKQISKWNGRKIQVYSSIDGIKLIIYVFRIKFLWLCPCIIQLNTLFLWFYYIESIYNKIIQKKKKLFMKPLICYLIITHTFCVLNQKRGKWNSEKFHCKYLIKTVDDNSVITTMNNNCHYFGKL